jgi:ATP-dependent Clp protease adaptor protein ClpS
MKHYSLILYDDSSLSTEYIMSCLIKYCNHEILQASQCVLITKNNGECDIFSGNLEEITCLLNELQSKKLNVKIKEKCV